MTPARARNRQTFTRQLFMSKRNTIERTFSFIVIAALCGLSAGCAGLALPQFGAGEAPNYVGAETGLVIDGSVSEKNYHAVRQAHGRNAVVLNVQGDSDPVRILPLPPDGKSVLVSDLLRQSGVLEALGSVDVVVFRHLPPSPTGLRLPVKMNNGHDEVRPETDYALRPGDRVQVTQHTADVFGSLIGQALGGS